MMDSPVMTLLRVTIALLWLVSPAWSQVANPNAQPPSGVISGTVVDDTSTAIAAAKVTLFHEGLASETESVAKTDGQFSFANIPSGAFRLVVSAPGFAEQTIAGTLAAGEVLTLPPIRLRIAAGAETVNVIQTRIELAQQQIQEQEQQRVLGFVPNFFVSYIPDAAPLTTTQKFELSWKAHLDPVQFAFTAAIAGIQQKRNDFAGFGDGPEGYAKRYAAAYVTFWSRGLITQVLLPSVFRQDPRYFYKGTGSTASRFGYAISRVVIRKGDNGQWQPNYSGVIGSFASGAISNLYYPAEDRNGIRLTLENTAIGLGGAAVGHIAQEFLFSKITSRGHKPAQP